MDDCDCDCCNPECHRIERELVTIETERIVRLRLDGDSATIEAIMQALHDLPDAA
jgi:hypothetical protein